MSLFEWACTPRKGWFSAASGFLFSPVFPCSACVLADDTNRVAPVTAGFFSFSPVSATFGLAIGTNRKEGIGMKAEGKRALLAGAGLTGTFIVWTILIQRVDVRAAGQNGTNIGFAAFNLWFHRTTGVHMTLYTVTDWLGLVPVAVCLCMGAVGMVQLIRRRSLLRVDGDILLLGLYYILVIAGYLFFEMVPINYRPVPIDGVMEASYPSSTALLVLSVMPTLEFQLARRGRSMRARTSASVFSGLFTAFMVIGRLVAGVHWATDILGSLLLGPGLFLIYRAAVQWADQRKAGRGEENQHGIS